MVEVKQHPNIELLTYSEVVDVSGYVGNFKVKILRKPRYVREDLCTGCGDCASACPVDVPNEFDRNLSWRKAVYLPFPQAVPQVYTIDAEHCLNTPRMFPLVCERCYQACAPKAINYDDKPQIIEREVGVIILATGYELYPPEKVREYGYGKHPDIVDSLEFERLLSASGPTGGEIHRPSDGKVPREVVFISCVGSRDRAKGIPYCSKICCMYVAKHAILFKHKVHDGQAFVFYMDVRAAGKGYEEFVRRAVEEEGVVYLRGRVSKIYQQDGKLIVRGVDTLSGMPVEIPADLVVLATAIRASDGIVELAQKLGVPVDEHGFLSEAHPKLRPVETQVAGVFLAGACQAPKDIPDTVAQASGAASKVLSMFAQDAIEREPTIAKVNEQTCVGCFECQRACPYRAIERKEIRDRQGNLIKVVAYVNPGLCAGCGACTVACRNHSVDLEGFAEEQMFAELSAITAA
jgi:Heterodisulfide reductase, subunit A and related polyferredoxins